MMSLPLLRYVSDAVSFPERYPLVCFVLWRTLGVSRRYGYIDIKMLNYRFPFIFTTDTTFSVTAEFRPFCMWNKFAITRVEPNLIRFHWHLQLVDFVYLYIFNLFVHLNPIIQSSSSLLLNCLEENIDNSNFNCKICINNFIKKNLNFKNLSRSEPTILRKKIVMIRISLRLLEKKFLYRRDDFIS